MNVSIPAAHRRLPALVLAALALLGAVVWARATPEATAPTFAVLDSAWMPYAPIPGSTTESWFCPGAPAQTDAEKGRVDIVNRTANALTGTATLAGDDGKSVQVAVNVQPWGRQTIDLNQLRPGAMVATFVEVKGGGAVVEQYAASEKGDSVLACATQTSAHWYFGDGYTVGTSSDRIVIANPYDYDAVASIVFAVKNGGFREPQKFSGLRVPARGVRVVELAQGGSGVQGEEIIGTSVNATRGRVVVGRAQVFTDKRRGSQVTLGAPATREQWWFPGTVKGEGISQTFSLYNPTDEDAEADVIVFGSQAQPEPIEVTAKSVVQFDLGSVADLTDGLYTVVISTSEGQSLVVERVTTTTKGDSTGTAVLMGAPPRLDGFIATSWIVGVSPDTATTSALVIHNADIADGAFTVYAVTPTGAVKLPNLDAIALPASQSVTVDLTDPLAIGQQVVVSSTNRIFVERSLPSGRGDLRTVAWAVPVLAADGETGS